MTRYGAAILAYIVPTFLLGFVWHLVLFEGYYDRLAMYRDDIIIPFGLFSMLIQAILFAWLYDKAFADRPGTWLNRGLVYAVVGGLLSWSFSTIAVAAKNVMTSVPDYLVIETAFTAVQWIIVGPLTALAFALASTRRRTPLEA
jgi:hypothetical protein